MQVLHARPGRGYGLRAGSGPKGHRRETGVDPEPVRLQLPLGGLGPRPGLQRPGAG